MELGKILFIDLRVRVETPEDKNTFLQMFEDSKLNLQELAIVREDK